MDILDIKRVIEERFFESVEKNRAELEDAVRLDLQDEDSLFLYGKVYDDLKPHEMANIDTAYCSVQATSIVGEFLRRKS